jgi:signal transduction histidine kinase/ligand-binding sensor domain-containing protein/DNA-binding response OmpR family regulator
MNDGLLQHDVSSITQDKYGFIWIATYDGLLRYDGYEFKKFRYNSEEPNSISDNRILNVFLDSFKNLWISTEGGGINLYNYQNENFKNFRLGTNFQDNNIYSIYEDEEHTLWLGTNSGLYTLRYSKKNNYEQITKVVSNYTEMDNVYAIQKNYRKDVILGTTRGVYLLLYNPVKNSYRKPQKISSLNSPIFTFKVLDQFQTLVGGADGLFIYNHLTNELLPLSSDNIKLTWVRSISQLSTGIFIVATESTGLYKLIIKANKCILSRILTDKSDFLEKSMIKTLFIDNMQNLWIGTGNNGIGRINLYAPKFYRLFDNENEAGNFIRYFYKDTHNRLWVQIKQERFFVYYNGKKTYVPIPTKDIINCISEGKNGDIWATTMSDLYQIRFSNGNFKINPVFNNKFLQKLKYKISIIRSVHEDNAGNVWIGYRYGLLKISNIGTPREEFKVYENFNIPNNNVNFNQLYFEKNTNRMWACSRDFGLFLFYLNNNSDIVNQIHFCRDTNSKKQLNSNHVWAVTHSSLGKMWVGTDAGLNTIEFINNKAIIKDYNYLEQIKNTKILSIIEDKSQNLWLSTSLGLIRYSLKTKQINHFYYTDGLSNNSLVEASQIDADGTIYLASINGITYFNPDEINLNPFKPKVLITKLKIFNNIVNVGEKLHNRILLPNSLSDTRDISLKYNENNFSIEYVAIHFNNPQSNLYAHQLVGYDKDWIYSDANNRTASYNNLPPGTYQLKIKAANSDGLWSENYCIMNIEIKAAPWATWWAYLIYLVIIIFIIYLIILYYKKQEKLQYNLHIEQLARIHDKELNDTRLKFYTNITHEIRTPLTLITAPLSELQNLKLNDNFITSRLNLIRKNTERLSKLVNQFLDLRKIDKDSMPLKVRKLNIEKLFNTIIESYKLISDQKQINLQLIFDSLPVEGWVDEDKISKIINNLLSNAIRFTERNGSISVFVNIEDGNLLFSVEDNGCGIPEAELSNIFERFYQCKANQSGGSGIGLSLVRELVRLHHGSISVKSEVGKGSTFIVTLPISKDDYQATEISEVESNEKEEIGISSSNTVINNSKQIVLVVEDDDDMRNYLYNCLSPHFEVLVENNSTSGYQAALKFIPNLILTDLMMPCVSGLEFCENLKNDFRTSHIPIIILTAKSSEEDIIQGYQTGAEIYVVKPFNPERLILQIKNMISYQNPKINILTNEAQFDKNLLNERERKFIDKLIYWLEENLEQTDYSVEDICRALGTSRMQLHRKLTALIGQSTSEFIRNYKMKRAKEFLESGNFNVTEVMYKVGFKSNSHFTKTFKDTYGFAPSKLLHKNG